MVLSWVGFGLVVLGWVSESSLVGLVILGWVGLSSIRFGSVRFGWVR